MTRRAASAFWGLLLAICFFGVERELWTPNEPRGNKRRDALLRRRLPRDGARAQRVGDKRSEPAYALVDERRFGPDRYMALWERRPGRDPRYGPSTSQPGSVPGHL